MDDKIRTVPVLIVGITGSHRCRIHHSSSRSAMRLSCTGTVMSTQYLSYSDVCAWPQRPGHVASIKGHKTHLITSHDFRSTVQVTYRSCPAIQRPAGLPSEYLRLPKISCNFLKKRPRWGWRRGVVFKDSDPRAPLENYKLCNNAVDVRRQDFINSRAASCDNDV